MHSQMRLQTRMIRNKIMHTMTLERKPERDPATEVPAEGTRAHPLVLMILTA
jgi:hypothetical protein